MPRPKITSGKSKTATCARSAGPPRSTASQSLPDDLVNRALEITRLSQDRIPDRLAEDQGDLPGHRRRVELLPCGQSSGETPADHALRAVASARVSPLYPLSVVYLRQVGLARIRYPRGRSRRFTATGPARSYSPQICAPSWRQLEQDRQSMIGTRRLQHVGRPSRPSRHRAKRSCSSTPTSRSSARGSGMKGTW